MSVSSLLGGREPRPLTPGTSNTKRRFGFWGLALRRAVIRRGVSLCPDGRERYCAGMQAEAVAKPMILVAAAALVDIDGRVLIAKRPHGKELAGFWEFPGGKVENGETPEQCLIRELDEELGIKVTKACLAPFVFTSHAYESFHLLMPLYLVRRWEGFVSAREHEAIAWVKPDKLGDYQMPPADEPLVAWLRDFL
jgi:8-oxo-dGTP diphosphatase